MYSDELFLLKLFFILQTLDTSGLETAKMIKVQTNAYLMTMQPIFKISFGKVHLDSEVTKILNGWNLAQSTDLGVIETEH
jgi:hypothetical protein